MGREQRLLMYVFGGWAAAMLLGALGDRDYAYYTLLRWVVCVAAVLVAILGLRWRHGWAVVVFAFVGILFNPLVPISFSPGLWHLIDIGVAALFLMAVALVAPPGDAIARRVARLLTRGHVDTLPTGTVMVTIVLLVVALGAVAFTTGVYRLDVARWQWRDELRAYNALPTEQAGVTYRVRNPEVDAKLFITGEVGAPQHTANSYMEVVRLMKENGIGVKDIKSLEVKKYADGTIIVNNLRDRLAEDLGEQPMPKQSATPTKSVATPVPTPTNAISELNRRRIERGYDPLPEPTPMPTPCPAEEARRELRSGYGLPPTNPELPSLCP